jgi:uncharacterized SAM-binding protein YcdF (DUF218 family)
MDFFALKGIARTLVLPPAGPLLLGLLGLWMARTGRRYGVALMAGALMLLWLFSTPLIAEQITRLAEHYPALDPGQALNAQAIVVIGGGKLRPAAPEYAGASADLGLLERINYTAFLARRSGLPVAISGAPDEVLAMQGTLQRNYAIQPAWIEGHSRDTFENARFSAKLLQPQNIRQIVLVTNSTHIWRATHEFMDAGFTVVPAPVGLPGTHSVEWSAFFPSAYALWRSNDACYELLGEPMRRLQKALGIREKLDRQADLSTGPQPGPH